METNIDLIPVEERVKRSKEKAQKLGIVVSILVFLFSMIASAGLYFHLNNFNKKIDDSNKNIESIKKKVANRSEVEITVRNLDAKYKTLTKVLNSKIYYSRLLDELSYRIPTTVTITTIDSSTPQSVLVSGNATDYISLAKFLNSLADPSLATNSAVTDKSKNLFTEIQINTVTLDPLSSKARFNLNLTVDPELLREKF